MSIRIGVSRGVRRAFVGAAGALLMACSGEIEDGALADEPAPTFELRRGGAAGEGAEEPSSVTGNGAPSGSHYTLNIIGMPKGKSSDGVNNGHRIFVSLEGRTRIDLGEGEFQVLDSNGTDGTARFQLPSPDSENDGITEYSVFARALGKPGGSSTTTTCATDVATGDDYCSIHSMVMVRESGKSSFTNVSRELLYVYADIDGDGTAERYPLFDDALQDYYWQYDNAGLKLLQLRFYAVSTNVN